jgi:polar amino acid transport system substrate-binding protein
MKHFARAIGLAAIMLFSAASAADAKLRFGVAAEPYPPFASKNSQGEWAGWEIDLMGAVCREMKEDCEIFESSWDGLIPALNAGYFDVIWATMSITPDRLKVIDFTDPYYEGPDIIIGQRNGDLDILPEHLAGKVIGVQGGSIHVGMVEQHFKHAKLSSYNTQDEAFQDLTAGRLDYVGGDYIALMNFLGSSAGSCCELKGRFPVDSLTTTPGVGGGIKKGNNALRERLNRALRTIHQSGEYDTITKQYFTFDISPAQ